MPYQRYPDQSVQPLLQKYLPKSCRLHGQNLLPAKYACHYCRNLFLTKTVDNYRKITYKELLTHRFWVKYYVEVELRSISVDMVDRQADCHRKIKENKQKNRLQ